MTKVSVGASDDSGIGFGERGSALTMANDDEEEGEEVVVVVVLLVTLEFVVFERVVVTAEVKGGGGGQIVWAVERVEAKSAISERPRNKVGAICSTASPYELGGGWSVGSGKSCEEILEE
jgi:hypothetical protein